MMADFLSQSTYPNAACECATGMAFTFRSPSWISPLMDRNFKVGFFVDGIWLMSGQMMPLKRCFSISVKMVSEEIISIAEDLVTFQRLPVPYCAKTGRQ